MFRVAEKERLARGPRRDIDAKLLKVERRINAGQAGCIYGVNVPQPLEARMRSVIAGEVLQRAGRVQAHAAEMGAGPTQTNRGNARCPLARRRPEIIRQVLAQ